MAVLEGKKKKYIYPPPSIVSINCSSFRSFYRTCRRNLRHSKSSTITSSLSETSPRSQHEPFTTATNSHSSKCFADGRVAAEAYWQRAQQLELELIQLNKWISVEKNLRDCVDNYNRSKLEKEERRIEIIRLVDGGFLSECIGRLLIQFSAPAIVSAEIGSDISQVLHSMASMGAVKLRSWLIESLPLENMQHSHLEMSRGNDMKSTAGGFMEDIVLASMEELEILVLEGLKFQMGVHEKGEHAHFFVEKEKKGDEECIVLVMLIQARDPVNNYEAVQDIMIGLVEASVAEEEKNGFRIESVHVAGISTRLDENIQTSMKGNSSGDTRVPSASNYLWSMSAKECEGRCSCHSYGYAKNSHIAFL